MRQRRPLLDALAPLGDYAAGRGHGLEEPAEVLLLGHEVMHFGGKGHGEVLQRGGCEVRG